MASQLFRKIPKEKRKKIEEALYKEFSVYPLEKAQVKRIVEASNIPRGSFYQYFDDIEDAFVYVLALIRKNIIEKHMVDSTKNKNTDKLTLLKESFKNRVSIVFSNLSKDKEHKIVSQIRKSEKAIDIFLNQMGVLSYISTEEISSLLIDEVSDKSITLLPEILFPTLKLTLKKLFKNEINVETALEEIDYKFEIIQRGLKS